MLRWPIHVLGALALAAYAALAALSYLQAPALWLGAKAPRATAFFEGLAERVPAIGLHRRFGGADAVIVSYWLPLAVASLAALALILMVTRTRSALDAAMVRLLARWSVAFAAAAACAYPVFTHDFWLSVLWGKMIAGGANPYHTLFTPEMTAGLPLDQFPMAMSYGPLWGLVSGAVMLPAGGSVLAAAILFKAVLAAFWAAALWLVLRITARFPVRDRCLAVAAFGWTPLGATQTLAEGHNDIVMAALALLWFHALVRRRLAAPVALAASVMAKFTTAPLVLVDSLWALRVERLGVRGFLLRALPAVLVGGALLGVFYRSTAYFDGLRVVSEWHFLRTRDAVAALERMAGIPLLPLAIIAVAAFPAVALYQCLRLWRTAASDDAAIAAAQATVAIMAALAFAAIAHVWPWYVIWLLAPAALIPRWWLSRFVIGFAVLAPFTVAFWWIEAWRDHLDVAALALYAGAAAWATLTRPAALSDR